MPVRDVIRREIGRKFDGNMAKFAAVAGMSNPYLNEILNGKRRLNETQLEKIAKGLGVPIYQLFHDEPLVPRSDSEKEPVIVEQFPDQETLDVFKRMKSRDDFIPIRIIGTTSLGPGRIVENEQIKGFALIYKHALPKGTGSKKLHERPRVVCLYAEGDSMSPTIQDKSLVAIDIDDRDEIKKNKIYAVDIPDSGVSLKRIIKTDDHLILFADNPNEPGFPTCLNLAGLRYNPVCGRVVWAWNKF